MCPQRQIGSIAPISLQMETDMHRDPPYLLTLLRYMPWLVLALLGLSALLMLLAPDAVGALSNLRKVVALLLTGATVVWFIFCFTGDPAARQHDAFVFAYAFTFGAFAMLVLPFASSSETRGAIRPPEGVLQLVRGCLVGNTASGPAGLSTLVNCPNPRWSRADRDPHEVARYYGWVVTVGGVAVRHYAGDLGGYPDAPPAAGASAEPGTPVASPAASPAAASPAGAYTARAGAAGDCPASRTDCHREEFLEIHGGMAVPLFVVVLAFIGGAVSLSRRLPEYQRRSEVGYVPTPKEPAMQPYQARESVVFQIMQLVSAPFLAMATWYMIEPSSLAVAIVLAFGTGFASEYLLLMIRGMVEGIRPETQRSSGPAGVPLAGSVVRGEDKQPVPGVTVMLQPAGASEMRAVLTDAEGAFTFAAVPPGTHTLFCGLAGSQPLEVSVGDVQPPPVQLVAP